MAVNGIDPTAPTNSSGYAPYLNNGGQASTGVGKDEFLQLLVTQLKNQDPLQPTDQKEMLAQMAQFSSLEQMQNMNQTLASSTAFSQMAQSASLIGKNVTALASDGSTITGTVSSVTVQSGKSFLQIGGQQVDPSTVTQIGPAATQGS